MILCISSEKEVKAYFLYPNPYGKLNIVKVQQYNCGMKLLFKFFSWKTISQQDQILLDRQTSEWSLWDVVIHENNSIYG